MIATPQFQFISCSWRAFCLHSQLAFTKHGPQETHVFPHTTKATIVFRDFFLPVTYLLPLLPSRGYRANLVFLAMSIPVNKAGLGHGFKCCPVIIHAGGWLACSLVPFWLGPASTLPPMPKHSSGTCQQPFPVDLLAAVSQFWGREGVLLCGWVPHTFTWPLGQWVVSVLIYLVV